MKKLILSLVSTVLMLVSCTKDDNNINNNSTVTAQLPKTINNDGIVSTVTYNGTKIVSIVASSANISSKTFTYTGDNIVTQVYAYGNNILTTGYVYDSNNKLVKSNYWSNNGKGNTMTISGKDEYVYNTDGTVTKQYYNNSDGVYVAEGGFLKMTYQNGNAVKGEFIITATGQTSSRWVAEFDTKNNPFKNVTGMNKILGGSSWSNTNNWTKLITTSTETITSLVRSYNYTYNTQGYPLNVQQTDVYTSLSGYTQTNTYNIVYTY